MTTITDNAAPVKGRTSDEMIAFVIMTVLLAVVPLTGLNRAYVQKGLAIMHARGTAGLTALGDVAGLTADGVDGYQLMIYLDEMIEEVEPGDVRNARLEIDDADVAAGLDG